MQRNKGSHTLLMGRKISTISLEKHLAASTKATLCHPSEHAIPRPAISTKIRVSTYIHKNNGRHL